ncbi:MAG: FtsX-like permease family protein [Halobacteria archaeon]
MTAKFKGVVSVAFRRVASRLSSRRMLFTVTGVGFAIGLMIIVTGVGLGFATQNTVNSQDVNYWIVPEKASSSTNVVSVGGSSLGSVHPAMSSIQEIEGVDAATPVLMKLSRVRNTLTNESQYLVMVGVVPTGNLSPINGVSPRDLENGDPHYSDGSYDGKYTDEVVLSGGASEILGADKGDKVSVAGSDRSLDVVDVNTEENASVFGNMPVGVLHLSELQEITGTTGDDSANQIIVESDSSAVESKLQSLYPEASVVKKGGVNADSLMDQDLSLALSIASLLVALVVGTLFVATTMGLEITYDRPQIALLGAIGFSGNSRTLLIITQSLTVTFIGGVLGLGIGFAGVHISNYLVGIYMSVDKIAQFNPTFIVYGLGVSLLIGLFTSPYLVYVVRKTDILRELEQ